MSDAAHLPRWSELPDIELYMDQVISQLNKYLTPMLGERGGPAVTASMINNYVKQQLLPAPNKKRYARIHLAHLVAICLLKQVLSIPDIRTLLFDGMTNLPEEAWPRAYDDFCDAQENAYREMRKELQGQESGAPALKMAVYASACKALAQELLAGGAE